MTTRKSLDRVTQPLGQRPALVVVDVINGFTDIILDVFGPEVGRHTRSAVGLAELPFDIAVEIEAKYELREFNWPVLF